MQYILYFPESYNQLKFINIFANWIQVDTFRDSFGKKLIAQLQNECDTYIAKWLAYLTTYVRQSCLE